MSDVLITARSTPSNALLDGVLIRIYSGSTLVTQGTTGEGANTDGTRLFDLAAGSYTMRLSMSTPGYSVVSPQTLTVTGVANDDRFVVRLSLFTNPESADNNLCRCSGYFKGPSGAVAVGAILRFSYLDTPILLGSVGLLPRKVQAVVDQDGYAVVDLVRGAKYRAEVEGYYDVRHEIMVPDLAGANLPDVLYPLVSSVEFTPSSVAMAVGETEEVDVNVLFRSGLELDLSELDYVPIEFTSSGTGLSVSVGDALSLVASVAGSYTITVSHKASDFGAIASRPAATISSTLAVTVS